MIWFMTTSIVLVHKLVSYSGWKFGTLAGLSDGLCLHGCSSCSFDLLLSLRWLIAYYSGMWGFSLIGICQLALVGVTWLVVSSWWARAV